MSLWKKLVCALTVLVAVALMAPVAALASGSPSAGDQQYIDPLSNQQPSTTPSTPAAPAPVASSPAPTPTAPASTASSTTSTPSAGSGDPSSKTLPFTGFDVWAGAGLGLCLLGSGVFLRRVLARP